MKIVSRQVLIFVVLMSLLTQTLKGGEGNDQRYPFKGNQSASPWCVWEDYPQNPILEPPPSWRWPNSILADPTVVIPSESPNGLWHLFVHNLKGILHYTSLDGISWEDIFDGEVIFPGIRAYVYVEEGTYFLLYERITRTFPLHSIIEIRTSKDLYQWSEPTPILKPTLPWEGVKPTSQTTGNPFLLKRDGQYWLYYSANTVFLPDCLYWEPKYIGLARADQIFGPYQKELKPIISPSKDDPYRNMGAGSIKLLPHPMDGRWIGFNNGIYRDDAGHSRSAILAITSVDGIVWENLCPQPIIGPVAGTWKEAFVYAFDIKAIDQKYRLYYNARDGWLIGSEAIGLAFLE